MQPFQNSSYDMVIYFDGIKTECDVKKLDKQNDFNTGKKGRDIIRPIKNNITQLLDSLITFSESDLFTPDEKNIISWFHDINPDELAVNTIKRLKEVCEMLSSKKITLRSTLPHISFTVNSHICNTPLDLYYNICHKLGLIFPSNFYKRRL